VLYTLSPASGAIQLANLLLLRCCTRYHTLKVAAQTLHTVLTFIIVCGVRCGPYIPAILSSTELALAGQIYSILYTSSYAWHAAETISHLKDIPADSLAERISLK
jgi:hypothetical protein